MLINSTVTANIPASDLGRARDFYADVLGLTPSGESPGGLVFTTAGGSDFNIYETEYAGRAGHLGGDVAEMSGFGHAAWFKDSEGNIMALIEDGRM